MDNRSHGEANHNYINDKGFSDHVWEFLKPVVVKIQRGIDAVARSVNDERLLRANGEILRQDAVRRERETPWQTFESEEVRWKTFKRRAHYGDAMEPTERSHYDGFNQQRDAVVSYLNKAKFLALRAMPGQVLEDLPSTRSERIEALGQLVDRPDPEFQAWNLLNESKMGIELSEVKKKLTLKFAEFLEKSASIGKQEKSEYRARLMIVEEKLLLLAKHGLVFQYSPNPNDGETNVFQRVHAFEQFVDCSDDPRVETPPPRPDHLPADASTLGISVLESLAEIYHNINNDIHELESRTVPLQAPKERSFAERTSTIWKAFTTPRSGSGSGMNWSAGIGQAKTEWAAAKTDWGPGIEKGIEVDRDRIKRIAGRAKYLYSQKPPVSTDRPTVSVTSPAETKHSEPPLEERGLEVGSPRAENPAQFPIGDPSITKVKKLENPSDKRQGYRL